MTETTTGPRPDIWHPAAAARELAVALGVPCEEW